MDQPQTEGRISDVLKTLFETKAMVERTHQKVNNLIGDVNVLSGLMLGNEKNDGVLHRVERLESNFKISVKWFFFTLTVLSFVYVKESRDFILSYITKFIP